MLRFNQNAQLTLTQQERLFSKGKRLIYAFSIAAILHILSLFLFDIRPLPPTFSSRQFTPITLYLQTDNLSPTPLTDPSFSQTNFAPPPILTSFPTEPPLPLSVSIPMLPLSLDPSETILNDHSKQTILSMTTNSPTYTFYLSGPIANQPHQIDDLSIPLLHHCCHLSYEVQSDQTTGIIFYWKPLHNPQPKKIEEIGQKLLQSIRFTPSNEVTLHGIVDIHLKDTQ